MCVACRQKLSGDDLSKPLGVFLLVVVKLFVFNLGQLYCSSFPAVYECGLHCVLLYYSILDLVPLVYQSDMSPISQ